MKKKIIKNISENRELIILLFVAGILCVPITVNGFFESHDGYSHIARLYNTIEALKDGQLPPVIVSSFTNGFGYSWNLMYPPLSNYIGVVFYFFTRSYVASLKLLIAFTIFASAIAMYSFIKKITKSNKTALIVSILYITAPYFLVDIYQRIALGEMMTLVFLPIMLHGLYNIFYDEGRKNYLFAIGAIGIVLSHIISTVFAVVIGTIFIALNIKKFFGEKKKYIIRDIIINLVFIILISLFFYIPLLQVKRCSNYICYEPGSMGTPENMIDHALYLEQLFFGRFQYGASYSLEHGVDGEMPFMLGLPIIIGLMFTIVSFEKIDKRFRKLYITGLLIGIITAIMSTNIFPWKIFAEKLYIIQFPWRLLIISNLFLSIIAGINIEKTIGKLDYKHIVIVLLIVLMYISPFFESGISYNTKYDETWVKQKDEAIIIDGGNKFTSTYEYLPVKARTSYLHERQDNCIVLSGEAIINNEEKNGNRLSFNISSVEKSTIELPYIYYPGYRIKVGEKVLQYKESEKGFIELDIEPSEEVNVSVKYVGTKIMRITTVVSIISLMLFVAYIIYLKRKEKNYEKSYNNSTSI